MMETFRESSPPNLEFPGAVSPETERPDFLKAELGTFINLDSVLHKRLKRYESDMKRGLPHYLPGMDHVAMEEFLYHGDGKPGTNPIDAWMMSRKQPFSAAAAAQISQWKSAAPGFFQITDVTDSLVSLRRWDVFGGLPMGESFSAISLSINGAAQYRKYVGH
ncbi:MAG: hypothetical protein KDA89_16240, partial [Planctomycetaceae bacterium]|nr:hypothetical protein [Planctomycetaceae bacterium]